MLHFAVPLYFLSVTSFNFLIGTASDATANDSIDNMFFKKIPENISLQNEEENCSV